MTIPTGPALAAGLAGLVLLLVALATTVGLSPLAAVVGLGCGVGLQAFVRRWLAAAGAGHLGPADVVTLARAMLACGIAALVVESFVSAPETPTLVGLTVVALVLDAVDGPVARRSGTASPFGARFDGEADAFLILILSVFVAVSAGMWVLAIGAARYVFGAAGWLWPWLREPLPFRYWHKVVTAVQGIVLCAAAAGILPGWLASLALAVALALLAESFGRDVVWLWLRRSGPHVEDRSRAAGAGLR